MSKKYLWKQFVSWTRIGFKRLGTTDYREGSLSRYTH